MIMNIKSLFCVDISLQFVYSFYKELAYVHVVVTFTGVIQPPTDVTVTLLTPRSVCVMWTRPSGSGVTGYLISYITTASYTRGGNMMVSGLNNLRGTLSTLEEDTNYIVIVQSTSNNGLSIDSNIVNITTYTAGK